MDTPTILSPVSVWNQHLTHLAVVFTQPTGRIWLQLMTAWVLRRGLASVTAMIRILGSTLDHHWTCYHRFFYRASWSLEALCRQIVLQLLQPLIRRSGALDPASGLPVAHVLIDETTAGRYGRHVAHADWYFDASATGPGHKGRITHWANCWLIGVLTLRLPEWPMMRWGLPVLTALFRKRADCDADHPYRSKYVLAGEMLRTLARSLPGVVLRVAADGDYAKKPFIQALPDGVNLVSRIRRNATLHALPPEDQKLGRGCGRRRTRGERLAPPCRLADQIAPSAWKTQTFLRQGHRVERQIAGVTCLWHRVCGDRPIRLVIVRNPVGREKDDFLFCTAATAPDAEIVQRFFDRWGVEEAIYEAKAFMGFEQTRGWCSRTVHRQAPLALLLVTLVKVWYLRCREEGFELEPRIRPWQAGKTQPSFGDMLESLRRTLWADHLSFKMRFIGQMKQWWQRVLEALAAA